eukprot:3889063-Amphidinium_carterae.1
MDNGERGSGATEDRETRFEYNEEREINNEYVKGSEYKEMEEIDENKETMEYNLDYIDGRKFIILW